MRKLLIIGVTASGKGQLAFDLAQSLNAEIISIDSMKVYRRMDIGTAKPTAHQRKLIKYHMIDIVEPSEFFNVKAFLDGARRAMAQIENRGKKILAVGGTALYIKALLYGLFAGPGTDEKVRGQLLKRAQTEGLPQLYRQLLTIDPIAAQRINVNDSKRIIRALEVYELTGKSISSFQKQWETHDNQGGAVNTQDDWLIIGLRRERTDTSSRINKRIKKMILDGLVDEVKSLLAKEKPLSEQARCAIGYAEIIKYLNGQINLKDAIELIKKKTRQLAKSQRTWFKTFQDVHWLDITPDEPDESIFERAKILLKNFESC